MKPVVQQPSDQYTLDSAPIDISTDPGSVNEATLDGSPELSEGTMPGTAAILAAVPRPSARLSRTDADLDMEYQPGETFGRYELVRKIAAGGMGIVYEARDKELHRAVALKMILLGRSSHPEVIERFYREARSAARLDHPHIVPIYEIGAVGSQHYFTMAMIVGRSLQSEIEKGGRMAPARAISLMTGIAEAVGYAHQHHIIHRDLKPDNILLDISGRPRVTDFGLAKSLSENSNLTQTGQVMGTPRYMSPEQARAGEACIGPSTDIYALGGILVFLLTGKPPFDGTSLTEVLCKVMGEAPLLPRDVDQTIPYELDEICRRCLAKKAEDRFATCEELVVALASMGGTPTNNGGSTIAGDSGIKTPIAFPSMLGLQDTLIPASVADLALSGKKSGKGLNAALIAVAALIVVVGAGLVITLANKSAPTTDTQAVAIGVPSVTPGVALDEALPGFDLAKAPVNPSTTLASDVKLDFKLLPTPAIKDGVSMFNEGESLRFEVKSEKNVYLGIWTVDPTGTIVQLFPNEDDADNLIRAGQTRSLPSANAVNSYDIKLDPSRGIEQLRVMASTTPWTELKTGREGSFLVYKDADARRQFEAHNRGAVLKRNKLDDKTGEKTLLTEISINYYVAPGNR